MVSENVDKSKEQNKDELKAHTSKAKVHNIVNASCTKLHELFSCQKVAHSVVFYVIIFLVLVVLLYIFRKLVSFPNGRYNGRKPNANTPSTGSRNPTNDSLPKEFPTKWPKLNTILKTIRTNAPESSDLSSQKEKKTRIYNVPGNALQGPDHFGIKANLKPGQNTYQKGYDDSNDFNPHTNHYAYSSTSEVNQDTNNNKQIPNKLSTSNFGTSYGYGQTPQRTSATGIPSSSGFTNAQYDWSSQQYNGNNDLKLSDPNWENSWSGAAWDINSNSRLWPYSDTSGSGFAKQQNTKYPNLPSPTSTPNTYQYGTWDSNANSQTKWNQPGSEFGWIKSNDNDNDNVNLYKSMTTPKSNNFYYDTASGKWSTNTYNFKSDSSNQYSTDLNKAWNPYSWNLYTEYRGANQTQDWSDFNYPTRNDNAEIGGKSYLWNNEAMINLGKIKSSEAMSGATLKNENDEQFHRWPLEDNRVDGAPKPYSTTFASRTKKKSIPSRKSNKNARNPKKARIPLHKRKKIRNKESYRKRKKKVVKDYKSNYVKKSVIPHPKFSRRRKNRKVAKSKKIPGKHISRKGSQKETRHSRNKNLKPTHHNTIMKTQKSPKMAKKQEHSIGKWQRQVHHVQKCKKLQSFQSNGKVHIDKKYLHKQQKYKYTVMSCRYVQIKKRDDNDWDDLDDDDDDEDEINLKRKMICRKFWFITNGKIRLQKVAKKGSQISYVVSLCRARVEPKTKKRDKIRTVNHHYHQTKHSTLEDDNDRIVNNIDDTRTDNDNLLTNQEEKIIKGGLTQSTKQRLKGFQSEGDDNDDDFETKIPQKKNDKNENGIFDKETHTDNDDDFDTETKNEHKNAPKNIGEDRHSNDFHDELNDEELHSKRKTKSNAYNSRQIKARRPDKMAQNDNEEDLDIDGDLDLDDDSPPKRTIKSDSKNMGENEHGDSTDDNNDFNAESSNSEIDFPQGTENSMHNNRQIKPSRPHKIKQNDDEDDLDIDDIDDTDDSKNSGYPGDTKAPQKPDDGATEDNDDKLDSVGLDDDLDDDFDNDIMDIDHKTAPKPKARIFARVKGRKAKFKNKHQRTHKKSASTKQKSHNKNNLKHLLHEFAKDKYTKQGNDVTKNLLAAILKENFVSISAPKHNKSKFTKTQSSSMKKSKQKHHFVPHKVQNERNLKALFSNMLTNSNSVKRFQQVLKTKSPENIQPATPTPHTKLSMKDLLKEFLPRDLVEPTISPTQKQTVTPTKPETQMKKQFAELLKKFGFTNNVPSRKALSKKRIVNLIKSADEQEINKPASSFTNPVMTANNPSSSPSPSSSPLQKLSIPSQPLSKQTLPSSPPSQQLLSPPQQQQTASQLSQSSPQMQPKFPATSPDFPYLNSQGGQEQATIQRSFIPTVRPQLAAQISKAVSIPQPQQKVKNVYGYSAAYSSNNNNAYDSYQKQQITNVLCFGDSLTSGFYNHGKGKHPYSLKLNQLLNPQGSHRYHVETRGVVGEMVHGSMTKRLPTILNEGTHFDWVLILGGTNDVAHVKNFGDDQDFTRQLIGVWSPKIVKDIEKLHQIARSYGSKTVLMTIPETAYELWSEFRSIRNMRLSVNAALRKYATEVRDTTVLCDLAYKLPRSTLSQEMQKLYWNDHIHLNPFGYDKMAEIIQQCIQPYLKK